MCIFRSAKFELYPEQTSLHLGYQQANETDQQWHRRAKLEKLIREEENFYRNASGQVPKLELVERKAAERQSDYRA